MTDQTYGAHSTMEAVIQHPDKTGVRPYYNNLTRRNAHLTERIPNRAISTSMASANIKALRLFRYICRMVPFILKVHQVNHRFDNLQTKRYIANQFRKYSTMTNLSHIDRKIQEGYELIHQAEWHYTNTGYLYRFISGKGYYRDHGIDRYEEERGNKGKKEAATQFLKGFYRGHKSQYK